MPNQRGSLHTKRSRLQRHLAESVSLQERQRRLRISVMEDHVPASLLERHHLGLRLRGERGRGRGRGLFWVLERKVLESVLCRDLRHKEDKVRKRTLEGVWKLPGRPRHGCCQRLYSCHAFASGTPHLFWASAANLTLLFPDLEVRNWVNSR